MEQRKRMVGVMDEMYNLTREHMSIPNAFEELIDNSIDAGAKNINVIFDKERNTGMVIDDGCGMDEKRVYKFVSEFCTHMPYKDGTIGFLGCALKYCLMRLSNPQLGSRIALNTWQNRELVMKALFRVEYGKEDEFLSPIVCQENAKKWTDKYGEHGTMLTIENLSSDVSTNRKWKDTLIKTISKKYSYLIERYGINIVIDGRKVKCDDRTHLSMLGDNMNTPGIYIKNEGYYFIVKKYTLRNNTNATDKRVITVVYHYFKEEEGKPKDAYNEAHYGMYSMFNGRFLQVPYSGRTYLPFSRSQVGGVARTSALIFVEDNEDILGLRRNKSDGIDISENNVKLNEYSVVNTKGKTFLDVFKIDYNALCNVAKFQSDGVGSGHNKEKYRELTVGIIDRIFNKEKYNTTLAGLKRTYDESNGKNVLPPISSTTFSNEEEEMALNDIIRELESGDDLLNEMESAPSVKYIRCQKNKETGNIDYCFTEEMPDGVNKDVVHKICDIVSNGKYKIAKKKIESMCTEIIEVLKAF